MKKNKIKEAINRSLVIFYKNGFTQTGNAFKHRLHIEIDKQFSKLSGIKRFDRVETFRRTIKMEKNNELVFTMSIEEYGKSLAESNKRSAIAFSMWKDKYMNDPPIGELLSNEDLYTLYLESKEKGE